GYDSQVAFDQVRAARRLYPAIDPVTTVARAHPDEAHADLAARARSLLVEYAATDPELGLPEPAEQRLHAAQRLIRLLAQPLVVAEPFTSVPGQRTTYSDLLGAVRDILSDDGGCACDSPPDLPWLPRSGCQLLGRLHHPGCTHLRQLSVLQGGECESASAGDEQVEHCPAQAQAARLAREPADHLRPPLALLERALQQVRRAQPLAEAQRVREVHTEGRQILGEAGGRARVLTFQVGDEPPQRRLPVRWRGGLVERGPVGRLHPCEQLRVFLRQLGDEVP